MIDLKEVAAKKFRDVLALLMFEFVAVGGLFGVFASTYLPVILYFNSIIFVLVLITISTKLYMRVDAIDRKDFQLRQVGSKLEVLFRVKWLNLTKF